MPALSKIAELVGDEISENVTVPGPLTLLHEIFNAVPGKPSSVTTPARFVATPDSMT